MTFLVHLDPFAHDVLFSLGGPFSPVAGYLTRCGVDRKGVQEIQEEFNRRALRHDVARTWHLSSGQQIIQAPVPTSPGKIAMLGHEVLHAVSWVLRRVGVEHTEATEEVYCYLHQHVMTEVLGRVASKHWK